jgi:hypothetical protein
MIARGGRSKTSTDVCGTARLVGLTVLATLLVGCGEQPIAPQAQPDLTARDNAQVSPLDDVPTWPVKVRYVVERRLDDQDYLERTEHEFAARSWDDWTDITIASSVRGENSTARGAVARWANGRYVGGILPDVASVGQSEFLPEATWRALEDSLQVAVDDAQTAPPEQGEVSDDHLPRAALEPDRPRAPSDVFNVGLATPRESDSAVRPLSPAEEIEAGLSSGPAADLEAVAGRLGLSADRLRRAALVHRVCADDLASCERWVTVYDPHTQIPLAVEWHLVGGERITLEASVVVLGAPDTPRGDS